MLRHQGCVDLLGVRSKKNKFGVSNMLHVLMFLYSNKELRIFVEIREWAIKSRTRCVHKASTLNLFYLYHVPYLTDA